MVGGIYEIMQDRYEKEMKPIWPNMKHLLVDHIPENIDLNIVFAGRDNILEAVGFYVENPNEIETITLLLEKTATCIFDGEKNIIRCKPKVDLPAWMKQLYTQMQAFFCLKNVGATSNEPEANE